MKENDKNLQNLRKFCVVLPQTTNKMSPPARKNYEVKILIRKNTQKYAKNHKNYEKFEKFPKIASDE